MIICQLCGREFSNNTCFVAHIKYYHKNETTIKDYYDQYIRKNGEGICSECGKATKFIRFSFGYNRFCSYKCLNNSPETKQKKEQSYLNHYGVKSPVLAKDFIRKKGVKHNLIPLKDQFNEPIVSREVDDEEYKITEEEFLKSIVGE